MSLILPNGDVYAQSTLPCVEHKQLPPQDWLQLFKGIRRSEPRVHKSSKCSAASKSFETSQTQSFPCSVCTHFNLEHVAYAKSILC